MWAESGDLLLTKTFSNSDGLSLLRLGYVKTKASILVSLKSLTQGKLVPSLKAALWRGPCYEGLRPANDHFSGLEIVFFSTLHSALELTCNLTRNLEPKEPS